jgi:hypothetical protein
MIGNQKRWNALSGALSSFPPLSIRIFRCDHVLQILSHRDAAVGLVGLLVDVPASV